MACCSVGTVSSRPGRLTDRDLAAQLPLVGGSHAPPCGSAPRRDGKVGKSALKESVSMAVRLRLTRTGKKKQPQYRVVAADARTPRDGRFLEILGWYQPRREPSEFQLDLERVEAWLAKGATPSERVAKLIEIARTQQQRA